MAIPAILHLTFRLNQNNTVLLLKQGRKCNEMSDSTSLLLTKWNMKEAQKYFNKYRQIIPSKGVVNTKFLYKCTCTK